MKEKIPGITGIGTALLLLVCLFSWTTPVSAGAAYWSAETTPTTVNTILGPAGIDIRDFALANDGKTIWAVPGNSVSDNVVYMSADAGASWTAKQVAIQADLVAIAPDEKDMVVIARSNPPVVYLTIDDGLTWDTLGTPRQSGAAPADTIYDIAVSEYLETIRYIAAAGKEAGDVANVWYFDRGAPVPVWKETNTLTGFSTGDEEVAAIAFSPGFSTDVAMLAVSEDDGAGVKLQILDFNAFKWNSSADYFSYPLTVISNSGITGLISASISLAPTFLATDSGKSNIFIGLNVNGNASAIATSGIYRFIDTDKTELSTNVKIHSVAFNGSYLVAGKYDTCTVYRSSNPMSLVPTFNTATTTKEPGGENKVLVAWTGSTVLVGTSGDESAFAISTDSGTTFTDISLIDTAITNARDVAVSAEGSKIYLATDDGTDLSLWRKTTTWERVLSRQGITNCIVRTDSPNANAVYVGRKGNTTVYYNSNGGDSQWLTRTCNINVQDITVESASVAYALNSAGSVSKTTNAGVSWGTVTPTTLDSGATIVSANNSILLVGSQNGYVAYSTDGNASWTKILEAVESGAGNVQVVADENFPTNKFIYTASDTAGQNIKRWKIGSSATWTDIFSNALTGGIYGLTVKNDTLYALEFNAGTGQSTLWLHLSPSTATQASISWSSSSTTASTDADDAVVHLNATPRALKASPGKVWAVKTNGTNKLYSFSDIAIDITLSMPAAGAIKRVNTQTGVAYDIPFSWPRPSETTEYELVIALDENFYAPLTTITIASANSTVLVMVGPNQTGDNRVDFQPGLTYYWKIRTKKPVYSLYSQAQDFYIEPLSAMVPKLLVPANGSTDAGRKPSFSWEPVASTTEYQFMLSTNSSMIPPIIDIKVENPGFAMTQELDYGSTYFWKIRATKPAVSQWSILANFTVEKEPTEPVPPVTVQQAPPAVIKMPEPPRQNTITFAPPPEPPAPVVPGYLWAVIIIVGVLLLVVIVLIFVPIPARLIPAIPSISIPLTGRLRIVRGLSDRLVKLWEDLIARVKELKQFRTLRDIITRVSKKEKATEKAEESQPVSFAARSFLWMMTSAGKEGGHHMLSAEEEQTLGKKLAVRIQALAKEQVLYLKFPGDAALFLQIWARYGSRDETDRYLTKSFRSKPGNAVALLKCYLTTSGKPDAGFPEKNEFTLTQYNSLVEVVNPDNVYNALVRLYKPEMETAEDKAPGVPSDRAIAYQFLRIHHQIKNNIEKAETDTE